jgi:hypothetical protein
MVVHMAAIPLHAIHERARDELTLDETERIVI